VAATPGKETKVQAWRESNGWLGAGEERDWGYSWGSGRRNWGLVEGHDAVKAAALRNSG